MPGSNFTTTSSTFTRALKTFIFWYFLVGTLGRKDEDKVVALSETLELLNTYSTYHDSEAVADALKARNIPGSLTVTLDEITLVGDCSKDDIFNRHPLPSAKSHNLEEIDYDDAIERVVMYHLDVMRGCVNDKLCDSKVTNEEIDFYQKNRHTETPPSRTYEIAVKLLGEYDNKKSSIKHPGFNYLLGDLYFHTGKMKERCATGFDALPDYLAAYAFGHYDSPDRRIQFIRQTVKYASEEMHLVIAYAIARSELMLLPTSHHKKALRLVESAHKKLRKASGQIKPELENYLIQNYPIMERFLCENRLSKNILTQDECYSLKLHDERHNQIYNAALYGIGAYSALIYVGTLFLLYRQLEQKKKRNVIQAVEHRHLEYRYDILKTLSKYYPKHPEIANLQQSLREYIIANSVTQSHFQYENIIMYYSIILGQLPDPEIKAELLQKIKKNSELLDEFLPLAESEKAFVETCKDILNCAISPVDTKGEIDAITLPRGIRASILKAITAPDIGENRFTNIRTFSGFKTIYNEISPPLLSMIRTRIENHIQQAIQKHNASLETERQEKIKREQARAKLQKQIEENTQKKKLRDLIAQRLQLTESVDTQRSCIYDIEKCQHEVGASSKLEFQTDAIEQTVVIIKNTHAKIQSLSAEEDATIQSFIEVAARELNENSSKSAEIIMLEPLVSELTSAANKLEQIRSDFALAQKAFSNAVQRKNTLLKEAEEFQQKREEKKILPQTTRAPRKPNRVPRTPNSQALFRPARNNNPYLQSMNVALINVRDIFAGETGLEKTISWLIKQTKTRNIIQKNLHLNNANQETIYQHLIELVFDDSLFNTCLRLFNGFHESLQNKDYNFPTIINQSNSATIRNNLAHCCYLAYHNIDQFRIEVQQLQEHYLPGIQRLIDNKKANTKRLELSNFLMLKMSKENLLEKLLDPQFHLHRIIALTERLQVYQIIAEILNQTDKARYEQDYGVLHCAIRSVIGQIDEHLDQLSPQEFALPHRDLFSEFRNIEAHEYQHLDYAHVVDCLSLARQIVKAMNTKNYLNADFHYDLTDFMLKDTDSSQHVEAFTP